MDTEEYGGKVRSALYGIADLYDGELPDTSRVPKIHQQMDQELLNLVTGIENHETITVKALENSAEQLITALKSCIGKIGTTFGNITAYQGNSFYTDPDVYALANVSQFFYQQHEENSKVYEEIWENEQALKDAAETRETQGIWKAIGGGVLIVTGAVCIVATGGAATPVVAAGWTAGGGTVAFGISDSIEGAQDIYYGSMGDIDSTAINGLRDTIFMGNNEAYYLAENLFAFSSSALIPISQAARAGDLTFRLGTATVVKEGISVAAGEGASRLTMKLSGNQTASMLAGMLASGATGHGLNKADARFHISGNRGGLNSNLLDELASSGVKYNADDVVTVMKNSDGKLMWLENGNSKAGLTHILERHADDFASQGVSDIPNLLENVLSTSPVKTGSNAKGLFADYMLNGNSYRVAYGTNGFVVSFYPID